MNYLVILLVILLGLNRAVAQSPLTATQAYEYLQGERHRADAVLGNAAIPPADSLKKAERILRDALTYYHRDDIQALAKNDIYLFARKGDISFDLAVVQAKLKEDEAAAQSLLYVLTGKGATIYSKYINEEAALA